MPAPNPIVDPKPEHPLIPPVGDPSLQTAAPESLVESGMDAQALKSVTRITETKTGTLIIPVHQRSIPTSHFSLDEQMYLPPDPPAFFYAHWIMTKPKMMFGEKLLMYTVQVQVHVHMHEDGSAEK